MGRWALALQCSFTALSSVLLCAAGMHAPVVLACLSCEAPRRMVPGYRGGSIPANSGS